MLVALFASSAFVIVWISAFLFEMRLSEALCRWKKALPGGHLWRGKYRLYRKVTPLDAELQVNQ